MRLVRWLFAGVGAVFLVTGIGFTLSTRAFLAEAVQAQGTVVDIERRRGDEGRVMFAPVVRFVTAGGESVEFVSSSASGHQQHMRGESVAVLYRPDAPASARLTGFFALWGLGAIFAGLGAALALTGGGMFAWRWRQRRRAAFLRAHGVRVETAFVEVERNARVTVNGRHPYRIVSRWQDPATARVHLFRSPNLWSDPSEHLPARPIEVLIDREDPTRHLMDVSFLPVPRD